MGMEVKRICILCFSATGNTEKAAGVVGKALAEKLGLESLPDEKKNSPGLFITDETLDSVCLIYKAPDGEIIYRYLDADGNTRSTLRDFFEDLAGQLQTERKRGDA